jgi:hypothetical protein
LNRELKLEWELSSNHPFFDVGFTLVEIANRCAHHQIHDLADLCPFRDRWEIKGYLGDGWMACCLSNSYGSGVPIIGNLEGAELEELTTKILPFIPKNHEELFALLGTTWFSSERFTYVGPYSDSYACKSDAIEHLIHWFLTFVVPEVSKLNEARVLRAIPPSPQFSLEKIRPSLWILECEKTNKQGTAFNLNGVGLVTCEHVLAPSTIAFRWDDFNRKHPIKIQSSHKVVDLAILSIDEPLGESLHRGSADDLKLMDHLAVSGFPNYRLGDSGVIVPGVVIGFRIVSSIRRVLTNAPIIAGNSGGPVLDKNNCVVGVAVTGADRMEEAQDTEDHGIVPIDALKSLAP